MSEPAAERGAGVLPARPPLKPSLAELLPDCRTLVLRVDPWLEAHADRALYARLVAYVEAFIAFHDTSWEALTRSFTAFARRYQADLRRFAATGRYASDDGCDADDAPIDRFDYDAALLVMTLVTRHRFGLLDALSALDLRPKSAAVIGPGPGIELHLLAERFDEISTFEAAPSPFCAAQHPRAIERGAFTADAPSHRTVVAIEVLEHLRDPFALLDAMAVVAEEELVFSTVTNCPQFDHRVNFAEGEVTRYLDAAGLELIAHARIAHHYPRIDVGAHYDLWHVRRSRR